MSIISRTKLLFRVKANAALDDLEHPVETLEYAEQRQRELLGDVGRGLIEVATARQRLSRQADQVRRQIPRLEEQARRALDADREDLARISLQRKQSALAELSDLEEQITDVTGEERSLMTAHLQLSRRVEEFRTQRTTSAARYQSAAARVKAGEALIGVSGELAELGMAVTRAQERTDRMQARASAIDALITTGGFPAAIGLTGAVERELRDIASQRAVEDELERMRECQPAGDASSEGAGG